MFRNPTSDQLIDMITVDGTNYTLAAGVSDVNTGIVDTRGFESVTFVVIVGTIATSGTVDVKLQQGQASNGSDMADLAGTASTQFVDTSDDKTAIISAVRPQERYLRARIVRGDAGNSTILGVIVILSNPTMSPVTQSARTHSHEIHVSPAEGTA